MSSVTFSALAFGEPRRTSHFKAFVRELVLRSCVPVGASGLQGVAEICSRRARECGPQESEKLSVGRFDKRSIVSPSCRTLELEEACVRMDGARRGRGRQRERERDERDNRQWQIDMPNDIDVDVFRTGP